MMKTKTGWMIVAGLLAGSVVAEKIALDDADFESQRSAIFVSKAPRTDWKANDDKPRFRTDGVVTPPSGTDVLHLFGGMIYQNLEETYVEGNTYTLSIYASSTFEGKRGALLAFTDASGKGEHGGDVLASTTANVTPNDGAPYEYQLIKLEYTATAADDGKTIGVAIYGDAYVYIDDASLTVTPAAP